MSSRLHASLHVGVAELTGRGRVHYHLCLWLPLATKPPLPGQQGWRPHGMTRAEWARHPVAYMVKYNTKGGVAFDLVDGEWIEREFPKGCRIHSRCGLDRAERGIVSWWCLPRYVREAFPEIGTVVRSILRGLGR